MDKFLYKLSIYKRLLDHIMNMWLVDINPTKEFNTRVYYITNVKDDFFKDFPDIVGYTFILNKEYTLLNVEKIEDSIISLEDMLKTIEISDKNIINKLDQYLAKELLKSEANSVK